MKLVIAVLFAALGMAQTVTLTWLAAQGNPPGTQYNLYRAPGACAGTGLTFTKQNATPIAGLTTTDTTISRGSSYCYRVTATLNGQESAPSGTAQADIPLNAPSGLTITLALAGTAKMPDGTEIAFSGVQLMVAAK